MHPFKYLKLAVFASIGVGLFGSAFAADYRVQARPGGVAELFESGVIKGGDRVILEAGRHGDVRIAGQSFSPPVEIRSLPSERGVLDSLYIDESAGLLVSNVFVLAQDTRASKRALVHVQRSRDVVLERLEIRSARSASGWSRREWLARAHRGVSLHGSDLTLRNSVIAVVDHAIESKADGALVEGNIIQQFRGDGIRALGDNSRYLNNRIEGCVDVDNNHDDGFQSWSLDASGTPGKGVVRNVEISGNFVRGGKDDHPFGCNLQGMGFFDGMFENWVIRDNVIEVNHWHGITVMGGRNVLVENNIVVDESPEGPGPPWITVTAHKDGRLASGSAIIGNVTQPRAGGGDPVFRQPQVGVVNRDNRVVETPDAAFR